MSIAQNKPNFVSIILGGLMLSPFLLWGAWSYIWWDMGRDRTVREVMPSVSDWPHAVQELHANLVATHPELNMDGFLMYGVPGPHSVSEAAFRIHDADQTTFDLLKSELQLVEIEPDHRMLGWGRVVVEKTTPEWWISADDDGTYYACQNLLDGEDGDLYVVAYASGTKMIYISYHFNF